MKGLTDLMKQAQQMQERMQAMQTELAQLEVTGEVRRGARQSYPERPP